MNDSAKTARVTRGFHANERARAAALYWQAFGAKLGRVLGPDERAVAFLADVLDPDFALVARGPDGRLLGLAGFKTREGALVGGEWPDLTRHYGVVGSLIRLPFLLMLERKPRPDELLMDGILVSADARGQGLGTLMLDAIKDEARARGAGRVRLDVIDTNPRARALYEREGFRAAKTVQLGPFRRMFGFGAATEMIWTASSE